MKDSQEQEKHNKRQERPGLSRSCLIYIDEERLGFHYMNSAVRRSKSSCVKVKFASDNGSSE